MSRAWVLNLDAEHELELGARYTPSAALRERVRSIAAAIAPTLEAEDVVLDPNDANLGRESRSSGRHSRWIPDGGNLDRQSSNLGRQSGSGCDPRHVSNLEPRAWCPTPRALEVLARAGLPRPVVPAPPILRAVNERGFAHALSEGELPGAIRTNDLETVASHVSRPSITGDWLLKRSFGVSGRGQRAVNPGRLSEADRAWVTASLRRGALYIEPRVPITRELSIHAWVTSRVDVRSIREQLVRDRAWVGSRLADGLPATTEVALVDAAERVGRALVAAGYHGPFGVDAYVWRTPSGSLALRTTSEINARYCMGWDARDGWDPPP